MFRAVHKTTCHIRFPFESSGIGWQITSDPRNHKHTLEVTIFESNQQPFLNNTLAHNRQHQMHYIYDSNLCCARTYRFQ